MIYWNFCFLHLPICIRSSLRIFHRRSAECWRLLLVAINWTSIGILALLIALRLGLLYHHRFKPNFIHPFFWSFLMGFYLNLALNSLLVRNLFSLSQTYAHNWFYNCSFAKEDRPLFEWLKMKQFEVYKLICVMLGLTTKLAGNFVEIHSFSWSFFSVLSYLVDDNCVLMSKLV